MHDSPMLTTIKKHKTYKVKYPESLDQATVLVLESVCLVNDYTPPLYRPQQL